jgi:hypothetical protein
MRLNGSVTSKLVSGAVVYAALGLSAATNLVAQSGSPQTHRFELRIENGEISNGSKPIQVQRDDSVEIDWSTDQRVIVHLHGYDILVTVDPGQTQKMTFVANATGRFPIELHGQQHRVLVYLEVHPR